jgi:hypothetical protein
MGNVQCPGPPVDTVDGRVAHLPHRPALPVQGGREDSVAFWLAELHHDIKRASGGGNACGAQLCTKTPLASLLTL